MYRLLLLHDDTVYTSITSLPVNVLATQKYTYNNLFEINFNQ